MRTIKRSYFADMLGGIRKGWKIGKPGQGSFIAIALGGFHSFAWASVRSITPPDTQIRSLQWGPLTVVVELPRLKRVVGLSCIALMIVVALALSAVAGASGTLSKTDARAYATAAASTIRGDASEGQEVTGTKVGACQRRNTWTVLCAVHYTVVDRSEDLRIACVGRVRVRLIAHSIRVDTPHGEADRCWVTR